MLKEENKKDTRSYSSNQLIPIIQATWWFHLASSEEGTEHDFTIQCGAFKDWMKA